MDDMTKYIVTGGITLLIVIICIIIIIISMATETMLFTEYTPKQSEDLVQFLPNSDFEPITEELQAKKIYMVCNSWQYLKGNYPKPSVCTDEAYKQQVLANVRRNREAFDRRRERRLQNVINRR